MPRRNIDTNSCISKTTVRCFFIATPLFDVLCCPFLITFLPPPLITVTIVQLTETLRFVQNHIDRYDRPVDAEGAGPCRTAAIAIHAEHEHAVSRPLPNAVIQDALLVTIHEQVLSAATPT